MKSHKQQCCSYSFV